MKKYLLLILLSISIYSYGQRAIKQYTTSTSGTVTITDSGQDIDLIHHAGATATLTIVLPSNPYDNQRVLITSQSGITALTLTSALGSITNAVTTLGAGASVSYKYHNNPSVWLSTLVSANVAAGTGTVTSVSVVTANGISATPTNPTTTPAFTFTLGAITPTTVVASSTVQTTGLGIGVTPLTALHISQGKTTAAWGSAGIKVRIIGNSFTDNTSSGTVATNYINVWGGDTSKAGSSTTYTDLVGNNFEPPVASTNVIATNLYTMRINGKMRFADASGQSTFVFGNGLNISMGSAQTYALQMGGVSKYAISGNANHTFTGTAQSSGTQNFFNLTPPTNTGGVSTGFIFTAAPHTSQTTNTEINDLKLDCSAVLKQVDGTVAHNRTINILARTYTPQTSALTHTLSSTLYVPSPIAGSGTTITTKAAIECDGNLLLPTVGNKVSIKEGSGGFMGQTILVAGTKAITVTGVTTSTRCFPALASQAGTVTATVAYECSCTANTVTITAATNAGTNVANTLDTSVLNYILFEPAP